MIIGIAISAGQICTPAKKIYDQIIRKSLMQDHTVHKLSVDRIQPEIFKSQARIRKLKGSYTNMVIDLEMLTNGLKRIELK